MTDRERIARALQSALGEDLSAVLDRVTKVVEEVRAEERETCLRPVVVMRRDTQARADRAEQMRDWETCGHEAAAVEVLDSVTKAIRGVV